MALKSLKIDNNNEIHPLIIREISILRTLNHPNIIKMISVIKEKHTEKVYI